MAILNHGSTIRTADGGQSTTNIVTASNIGTYGVAANSTYYVGTTQNIFNRASGAQTLTGVSIDGNAANITAYTINQNVGSGNTPSFAGINSTAMLVSYTSLTNGDDWSNSPISIRERGLVSAAQSINAYSPNLNFHWGSRISNSLWMDANGNLAWGSYSETGVPSSDGAFYAANLYASIYYDKNNTAYYVDPASTSVLNALTIGGNTALTTASTLTAGNLSGTIPSGVLANSTVYVGTTAIALNRGSASQTLTGTSIDGNAATATILQTARNINGTSFNGSAAITTATWGTARTLTIGSTGKSVDGSAAVAWSLAEIGAAAIAQTMFIGTTSVAINRGSASQTLTGVSIDGNAATATNGLTTSNYVSYSTFSGSVTSTYGNFTTPGLIMGDAQYGFYVVSGNVYYKSASGGVHYWRNIANSANTMSLDNSGTLNLAADVRAPIFYDSNDTAYYVDPNSVSRLSSLRVYSAFDTASSDVYANMRVIRDLAFTDGMYIGYGNAGSGLTRIFGGGATTGELVKHSDHTVESNSFRAPIFYDNNNTAYYLDAANSGTSLLVAGKVGIGTTSPGAPLEVSGASGDGVPTFKITSTSAPSTFNYAGTMFNSSLGESKSYSLMIGKSAASKNSGYIGYNHSGTDGSNTNFLTFGHFQSDYLLNILGNGNVGIGTTSPANKLHVVGSAYSDTDFRAPIFYDSNDTGYFLNPNSTSNLNNLRAATISAANHGLTCVYYGGGATPTNGYLITTNIDYSTFNMPTVIIEGYAYGNGVPIHLEIVWYAYNNSWTNLSYTNLGAWNPGTVSIGTNASGKVCLHLSSLIYYGRFNVRCIYDQGNAPLEGWTVTDATTSALTRVTTISKVELATSITGNAATVTNGLYTSSTLTAGNLSGTIPSGVLGNSTHYVGTTAIALNRGSASQTLTGVSIDGNAANITAYTINQNVGSSNSPTFATLQLTRLNFGADNAQPWTVGAGGTAGTGLTFGGDYTSSQAYKIFTAMENVGGNYSKLTLNWHTGIRIGAYYGYGGTRFYNNLVGEGTEIFSVGNADSNVRVVNNIYAQSFYDITNTAYYLDPASTSNLNALTVAGGNATIYRDLIVNGGGSGNFGNRIIVQGTATTYTYQDTTLRPTVYLNGAYPVVTLNATESTNTLHGPTLQFAFNGLTTGGATSRQIVIGTPGTGSWLDFGFSGGANGDNSTYNPHNGIGGYNGVTAMRLFSNGLLLGSTGAYPSAITSTSFALDVRGTGSSNTDFRAPIFYDSANTAYYLDPASTSILDATRHNSIVAGSTSGMSSAGAIAVYSGASPYISFHDGTTARTAYFQELSGRFYFGEVTYTESEGSFRAPLFYDTNNTAYYLDPASTSRLNIVHSNYYIGEITDSGNGDSNAPFRFESDYSGWSMIFAGTPGSTNGWGTFWAGNDNPAYYYFGTSNPNEYVFVGAGSVKASIDLDNGQSYFATSLRSPIFYDSDNTAYYIDAASTSNLLGLTVTNTITGSISGNAGTAYGLNVHTGRNNEVNKVVRTDGNGYIQAGWINTDSGDSGFASRLTRITCSTDNYLRYLGLTDFKVSIGGSAKNNYSRRVDYSSDANYHVGSFGHNGYGANETFHGGSGFIDIWDGTNYPSGLTHIHGFNALHYTTNSLGTTGGTAYGWQMVAQYNTDSGPWWRRCSGGSFGSWFKLVSYGNNQSGDIYAQRYYDNDNTVYYTDPASTSNLLGLTVVNTITGSITGNAGGSSASCSGNAANVTGTVAIANGGTGATTASAARANLGITTAETSSNQSLSGTTGCTIDVAAASVHILSLASATTISSFTYNNRSASPLVNTVLVVLKFAGSATITWSNVVWSNSTTPTLTGANGKADVYALTSYKGGATGPAWIGSVVGQNIDSTNL